MHYTLLDKNGEMTSIAIEEGNFDKPIVRHPETGEPTSYKDLGYSLGFEAGHAEEAFNPAATVAAAKAQATMNERAAAVNMPTATHSNVMLEAVETRRESKRKSEPEQVDNGS